MIEHKHILLPPFRKGFHLITHLLEKEMGKLPEKGLVNIFIKHTSAGLSLNENADSSVRYDMENFFNAMIPENHSLFTHTIEGEDDMPAHIKSVIVGNHLTIPVTDGKFDLGTWQGIYLCEFRRMGGPRKVTVTIFS